MENYYGQVTQSVPLLVTIFDGTARPRSVHLERFGKDIVSFGRGAANDIQLNSQIVSSEHGRFRCDGRTWVIEDKAAYRGAASTNGLIYNNAGITSHSVGDGDFVRIDDSKDPLQSGVLLAFSSGDFSDNWREFPLSARSGPVTIGRDRGCDIPLPHVSVSKLHASITRKGNDCYITDHGSTNGVIVNNRQINGRARLREKDIIVITNTKLIYTSAVIYYCSGNRGNISDGVSVTAADVVIRRGRGKITCDHVSLGIRPGELVAIIGGSGAGKSTILNCLCGYLKPAQGQVCINNIDLYQNFDALKTLIGYVPQSDIVYDDLTLHDMLSYTAKLRLPKDTSREERERRIADAIAAVKLSDKGDSLIKSFSGGQRKRASIAVELLSDPNLLFLDEPASGLDPWTERDLMETLRDMADSGKTVILVTHSTLQLRMCDKVVFMGSGGRLCFCGPYEDALAFFGVDNVVDVYEKITNDAVRWSERFKSQSRASGQFAGGAAASKGAKKERFRQFLVLCSRYLKLITNDRQRLLLLFCQAPLLALLISLVADGQQFEQYEMTKSLLFALSCSAFWIGMLNAIQEICKERTIMKREYMAGLSLSSYVLSKLVILGAMCLLQSVLIAGVFRWRVGLPEESALLSPFTELLATTFITAVSATAMGLFVSSLFTNADRAMTVAPILLMPQILFSGLIFKLSGATEIISWFAVCRWSMEGYGTTANLNDLPLRLQQEGIMISHVAEEFFDFTVQHLLTAWGILLLYVIVFIVLARLSLSRIGKERS